MPDVRIANRRIWVGAESRALLAGEVHYWRLDPDVWPTVLARVRELGLDVLSTYVCWDFHEVEPGRFDFRGESNPRRNLLAFLDLVRQAGFWLLLRPGPYIYAEWPNSGVPERVVKWHRAHESYRAEALRWMSAVVEAARPFLATHSGPIVMLQADNEADPWTDVYAAQLGLSSTPGPFHDFLRTRYGHIAELNVAWGTTYSDFDDARAVLDPVGDRFLARYRDVCRFRQWYATDVVRWTTYEYRRLGIDVPIYTNTYASTIVQNWRELETVCDLAGPDIYPTTRLAEDPEEHRELLDSVRYARAYSALPYIPEFESGIWHGWHVRVGTLRATHYELNALSALHAGICGWSWYMLASRDSWYMSPITELGRFRPELAPAFRELVQLFRALDPPSLVKVTSTAATFNVLERGTGVDDGKTVLRTLCAADVDYEFFDLDSDERVSRQVVLYAGGKAVSRQQQRRLQTYVDGGGTLVVFQPPSGLLGVGAPHAVASAAAPQRLRLELGEVRVDLSSEAVFVYDRPPGDALVAERIDPLPPTQEGGHAHVYLPVGERLTFGYVERRGRGQLVVLGVEPSPELMLALHTWLGVRIASRATPSSSRVHSALFRRGTEYFVVLTNTADDSRDVALSLDLDVPLSRARDLRTGCESPVANGQVTLRVPARSGTAVQLS